MKKILVGFFTGLISGMFASGGGLILLPVLIHKLNLDEKKARATTIYCILPMVIASSFFYYKNNYFDFGIGIRCMIGGIIGGIIGVKLLEKISNKTLSKILILFLIYSSIKLII